MTDGETLLLVFALIYLSDCLVWVGQPAYAFISFWTKRFFLRRAAIQFPALRGGFAVLNPLPPLGTVFLSQAWPVSLSNRGIAPFSLESPNPGPAVLPVVKSGFLSWDEVESISADEKKLRINGEVFALLSTRALAQSLAERLLRIRNLSPDQRDEAIRSLVDRSFRTRNVSRLIPVFLRGTRWLRALCIILFIAAFLVLPVAYWFYRDHVRFFAILLVVWILMVQIAIEFICLHRRFYPALTLERWQHFVLSILLPQYAIRSIDVLSKGFVARFHPIAVGKATTHPDDCARLADAVRRDATHPVPIGGCGAAIETAETFHREFFVPALEAALGDLPGGSMEDLEASDAVAFCPRCRTPYEAADAKCDDCGGIPVKG